MLFVLTQTGMLSVYKAACAAGQQRTAARAAENGGAADTQEEAR